MPPNVETTIMAVISDRDTPFSWEPLYAASSRLPLSFYVLLRKLNISYAPRIFKKVIKWHHPQILHSHFGDRGWYDLHLKKDADFKHVVTFYGFDVSMLPRTQPKWRRRYQKLFAEADLFLCEGPFMAQKLVDLGCPSAKVRVHHIGVDVEKIPFRPRQLAKNEPLRILLAGTFREKKGFSIAIRALGAFKERYPSLKITIIGDATAQERDQQEKKVMMDFLDEFDLKPQTRLLGYQPYDVFLKEAYNHHVFLSPSITAQNGDSEGGAPISLIDMAASGMPIISTRHCDIPNVIRDGETGLLADEGNVLQLVEHLDWLVDNSDQWAEMVYAGRRHIDQNFNVQNQARELSMIYEQLLSEN